MLARTSLERGNIRLAERRRLRRRRGWIAFCILLMLMLAGLIYGLQQSAVRISRVQVFGSVEESLSAYAISAMQGNYFGIIPRDSIMFFPEDDIRGTLLAMHPEFAAVSISRNSFTSISIKIDNRVPVARWCGDIARLAMSDCYLFDAKGYVFAKSATTTQTINSFMVYEQIENTDNPIRTTLPNAEKFPSAFDFARQLSTFGSPVSSIAFNNGEVVNYLENGTRVMYVLGNEQNAFTALASAKSNLNLADGSVEYVDLRFDGKVYVKKMDLRSP